MTQTGSDERYELKEVVGRGGMSTVYRAYDTAAEMEIAVKVLHEHLADDEAMVEAFEGEARLMRDIDEPGVVNVFGVTDIDGRPAIAMEYCGGGSLDRRLARRGRFEEAEAIEIITPILTTLDGLHDRGIIHRDIKPQNVLFDDRDRPRLIDFGIGQADELIEVEDAGQVGTVEYMAPERIDGLAVDGRSDLYSAGVMLFELVCGHVPYRADAASAVMRMHREAPVPDPELFAPDVSRRVRRGIRRSLQKHPEQRFDRARDMQEVVAGRRRLRDDIPSHPDWTTLKEVYGGESTTIAPVETEGWEWVVFAVDYDDFDDDDAEALGEIVAEHGEHLAVDRGRIRRFVDVMRTGTTVDELLDEEDDEDDASRRSAIKWRQMLSAYGVARGLSRQGAEQLVERLEAIGIIARFARRRRRRRTPAIWSKIFSPDNLAATSIAAVLSGVVLYLMAAQRVAEESGQMSPALMVGFLGICAVVAVTSAWAASAGMIAELWRSNFSRRYLLDFCRTSTDLDDDVPVERRHVELLGTIESPRIAASFDRAMTMSLYLREILDERDIDGGDVDGIVDSVTSLARRIVDVEATVAAVRPGELAHRIRQLDGRIAASDEIDAVDDMMANKQRLREQLEARDRARQQLQKYGQRLLDIATRLEKMVRRFRRDGDERPSATDGDDIEATTLELEELTILDFDDPAFEKTLEIVEETVVRR